VKYTVITTFHGVGLQQYGQRMIDTFEKNWPREVDLMVFAEDCQPQVSKNNSHIIDLKASSRDLREFLARHRDNDLAHGRSGPPDVYNPRKQFRWDAVRFCYKVFSVAEAAQRINNGWMIWLDADTHTHTQIPQSWLSRVCPADSMISYIGRGEKYHSECGWVAYNLDHPATRDFVKDFVDMYVTDSIFDEREWHDSYIWDVIRRKYQHLHRFHDLNPEPDTKGLAKHPFINSELGGYMDHVKGDRKHQGHSKSKEIAMHLDNPYWRRVKGAA